MRRLTLLVIGAALLVVAACGDDGSVVGTAPADGDAWGRTFLTDGPPPVRVTFTDDHRVTAQAECNILGGNARIEDGVLQVDEMGGTAMGCDAQRHAYDEWLSQFLSSSPTITLDGATLSLTSGTDTLVLTDREIATPDRPLVATRWVVDGMTVGDSVSSVPPGVRAELVIEGGTIESHGLCNGLRTAVTVRDGSIELEHYAHTEMSCGREVDLVETAVYAALRGTVSYSIDADVLRLTGPEGRGLTLRAS